MAVRLPSTIKSEAELMDLRSYFENDSPTESNASGSGDSVNSGSENSSGVGGDGIAQGNVSILEFLSSNPTANFGSNFDRGVGAPSFSGGRPRQTVLFLIIGGGIIYVLYWWLIHKRK
jgi:hypothetical protein